MPEGPLLIADALTRTVDGAVLVRDVSFQVDDGDVFTVFGPSGAGKSTLLRLLNRLDEPTSGTVYLGGMDYRQLPPQQVRRRIGLVSQQPTLINGTVANNVAWGPELRGEPIDRDAVEALLTRLGLKGFADRPADELSGGEAQRVAMARTLFNEPEIVLLDEPASSLDADAAHRVETVLADVLTHMARAAILVTHDADRARRLGTAGLRLRAGEAVCHGAIDDIVRAA